MSLLLPLELGLRCGEKAPAPPPATGLDRHVTERAEEPGTKLPAVEWWRLNRSPAAEVHVAGSVGGRLAVAEPLQLLLGQASDRPAVPHRRGRVLGDVHAAHMELLNVL